MTDNALIPADDKRELAVLKALGFDRLAPEQRELALAIAKRYELDPMLRHIVIIDGKPIVTRDGLLHVAHRSGVFDGIQVTQPVLVDGFWRVLATVWRKDFSHSIEYPGRFPDAGRKGRPTEYAEEMAIKVAESMALRRAFDVAAPIMEERWDVEVPAEPPAPRPTLAERAAAKAAEVAPAKLETWATDDPKYRVHKSADEDRIRDAVGSPAPAILAEPMTVAASEAYVNVEEVAEGAPAVGRWDRDTVHEAAQRLGVGRAATKAYAEVAGDRKVADLTPEDWAEIARKAGLE